MLNCCLSQINRNLVQQIMEHQSSQVKYPLFQTSHAFKATNLPKSFGCQVHLDETALRQKNHAFT